MIAKNPTMLAVLFLSTVLLVAVPDSSEAQMLCLDCHDIHNSPGGTLNIADEFDLICDTCHGPAATATAVFADRHIDPSFNASSGNTGKPLWELGCSTCHTPHYDDTVNHLYNDGVPHQHLLGGDSGNLVQGINIKLLGRDEDGTGIAKIATPLRIRDVRNDEVSCPNSNTHVEVFLPPFSAGDGPPATIMVGDHIVINNGGAEFDGTYRVKETSWTGFLDTTPTGWVCFDGPGPAVYDPTGFVRSMGWYARPWVFRAEWVLPTATLHLFGEHLIRVGDTIEVTGVTEVNPGTFNGVKTVTAVTNTEITTASWSGGTATVTLAENHLYQVGERIDVSGVLSGGPGEFNGRFTITVINGQDVSYALATDPGAYVNKGFITPVQISRITYASADPGTTNVSGGDVAFAGSRKPVQSMAVVEPPGSPPFLVTALSFSAGNRPERDDTVVLTLDRAHPFQRDEVFSVTGIIPAEYNGTWIVDDVPAANQIQYLNPFDPNPGAYVSGGEIPDPEAPPPVLEITLTNSDASINQFQPATGGVRDGDIITVFGVDPAGYNGRFEVESVALPVVTVRCPPVFRTAIQAPGCTLSGLPAYVSGGEIQSTGTMRPVVFESRGTDNTDPDFLSDYTHSFANTDQDNDGWMDGPCEICHTETAHHLNDDLGSTHNNGRTCAAACHTHSVGFDRSAEFCPPGRTCPPVN